MYTNIILLLTLLCGIAPAYASDVVVVDVAVSKADDAENHYDFNVTLQHADTGWDHYADKWEVLGTDGKVYATRVLFHPHVHEQHFMRSLENVAIPANVEEVTIRAHAKPHGYSDGTKTVKLP